MRTLIIPMKLSMLKNSFDPELYQYALNFGLREHPVLTALRAETAKMARSVMQIAPDQGQLMGLLAKLTGAKRYLELGVFTGYSALVMALAMGKDGRVTGLDINSEYLKTAHKFWQDAGVNGQINVIVDEALKTCAKLLAAGEQFDIAFIDANKTDYMAYYEYCYQLVRHGGLILIDNVLFYGEVLAPKPSNSAVAIKQLNEFIKNDSRVDICLLPIADGLTIAYKKELK